MQCSNLSAADCISSRGAALTGVGMHGLSGEKLHPCPPRRPWTCWERRISIVTRLERTSSGGDERLVAGRARQEACFVAPVREGVEREGSRVGSLNEHKSSVYHPDGLKHMAADETSSRRTYSPGLCAERGEGLMVITGGIRSSSFLHALQSDMC